MQVVEGLGDREWNWAKFIETLPPKEPRMCVFDLEYTSTDGMNCSKLFFCYWLPDGTPLKQKLTYATFKENFKTFLDVGGREIVLNSADDVLFLPPSTPSTIWLRNSTNEQTHSLHSIHLLLIIYQPSRPQPECLRDISLHPTYPRNQPNRQLVSRRNP